MLLYYTADLRSSLIGLPFALAPPTLWLTFADSPIPAPAWRLDAEAFAWLWPQCVRYEDRWAKGDYPADQFGELASRWAKIASYAHEWLDEGEVLAWRERFQRGEKRQRPANPELIDLVTFNRHRWTEGAWLKPSKLWQELAG